MHLSSTLAVAIALASAMQVSTFAFVSSGTPTMRAIGVVRRKNSCVRPRGSVLGAKKGGELEDIMDEVAGRSEVAQNEGIGSELPDEVNSAASAVAAPSIKSKRRSSELDDIMSEVAARKVEPSWEDIKTKVARSTATRAPTQKAVKADEEEIIVPMHAGAVPLPPGKIAVNPMEGMDAVDVPGKIVLDPQTLVEQQQGLEKIAQQLRRERLDREAEESVAFGFCPKAELFNGRSAMFGITVGLLTEYWTGQSIPQQVETMIQVLGLVPLDYESYFS